MDDTQERNLGPQPLDTIMTELGIDNPDLVGASTEQLTHKQVQKGRKGRRLTPKLQRKVVRAMKAICKTKGIEREYQLMDLFTYHG